MKCRKCQTEFSGPVCPSCGKRVLLTRKAAIIIIVVLLMSAVVVVFQLMRQQSAAVIESKMQLKTEARQKLEAEENADDGKSDGASANEDEASGVQSVPQMENKEILQEKHDFVLNAKTNTFHLPSCAAAKKMKAENREERTSTAAELIEQGYEPCGTCAKAFK